MTVPAQTTLFNESTANGVTTSFPYQFMISSADDIAVELDGVVTTTGFTVTGVGVEAGGSVDFVTAPADGVTVLQYLNPVFDRETNYQQFGDWLAPVVNLEFDRLWLAMQSLAAKIGRAIKLPTATAADQTIVETASERAGKVVGFDAVGDLTLITAVAGTSLIDLAASSGTSIVGYIQAGSGAEPWDLQEKLREEISITDYIDSDDRTANFLAPGSIDFTTEIQAAIDYVTTLETRFRALFIPPGQFNFTTLTIPAGCDFLTIRGAGRMASRLFSTDTSAGVAIDCLAQGCHFSDFRLMNADIDTSTLLRHGFRFKKPVGESADVDCDFRDVEISEFYYGIEHWGRGLNVQNCLFSICNYPINLNWPDVADYAPGSESTQTDLTGFRAFRVQNCRFHSIGVAAIRNAGSNAAKINGVIVTGNILDIGRTLYSGVLIDALIDGNVVNQTPTEGLLLTSGSKDYVVSNMVINGDVSGTPDRDPDNFIKLTGTHTNGVFRDLFLKNCDSHGIDIRSGVVSSMLFENIMFVDPCASIGSFAPIAFVGASHSAVVRNIVVSTSRALTGIVRTDDASANVQVDDARSFGAVIPAIVGTGKKYIDAKYAQKLYLGDGTVSLQIGTGTPESAVTAFPGSLFLRTDGSTSTTLYVKCSGSGNTGWVAK